ncbi:hypothetical protein WMF30_33605 [Sorangium sp. So ce134]
MTRPVACGGAGAPAVVAPPGGVPPGPPGAPCIRIVQPRPRRTGGAAPADRNGSAASGGRNAASSGAVASWGPGGASSEPGHAARSPLSAPPPDPSAAGLAQPLRGCGAIGASRRCSGASEKRASSYGCSSRRRRTSRASARCTSAARGRSRGIFDSILSTRALISGASNPGTASRSGLGTAWTWWSITSPRVGSSCDAAANVCLPAIISYKIMPMA